KKNFLFAGHFAIDEIIHHQVVHATTLGGSVSFGSLALRAYVQDVTISIISNLGKKNFENTLLDLLKNKNIDLEGLKWYDKNNTNFILDYTNHSRTLTLKFKSPNLKFDNIPRKYLHDQPDVIVLVPICNEISYKYIKRILQHFPNAYIGIDLQGFIRKINKKGRVSYIQDKIIISNMKKIMDLIGDKLILKGSEVEMKLLSNKKKFDEVMEFFKDNDYKGLYIMTLGEKGSMITKKGKNTLKIPAFKPRTVIDETGAGDVYFAIFLYELLISDGSWESIENAGYIASSAASFLVENIGPIGVKSKEQVLHRVKSKNYIN
ncbi:MAG: PfkB family carbohydrate kinase, partial [Promethearchaeota archaeon]